MKTQPTVTRALLPLLLLAAMTSLSGCDSSGAGSTAPINIGGGSGIPGGSGSGGGTGIPGGSGSGGGTGIPGGSGSGGSTATNSVPLALPDVAVVQVNSTNNPINVLANDSDANGDSLSITAASVTLSVPAASSSTVTLASDSKSLRYTPPAGFVGTQTLSYTISDGRGGFATALVVVTVSPLALPPVALPDTFMKLVDAADSVLNVLANDIDGAGGGLVVTAVSSVATLPASNAGAVSVVSGALHYQPKPGFTGVETLSYTLRDANGATATAAVVITVLPLAAPPVALPDVVTLNAGASSDIDVLANDVDLAGGGLTLSSVTVMTSLPPGGEGNFSVVANRVRYVPTSASFIGTQSASYLVTDQNGSTATGLLTVVVTPTLPQVPPLAVADLVTLSGGTTAATLNVLSNDIDVAGGGLSITTASVLLGLPNSTGVTLSSNGSSLQLSLPANYAGVLTLSYTITDANGSTATAPVVVTVAAAALPSIPPIPVPDLATVAQDSTASLIDVLANDIDPAGGGLSLSAVSTLVSLPDATHTLSISGNQLQFTPATGYSGVVTVSYSVTDINGNSADGLLTLTVTPALLTAPPLALPDVAVLAQDSAATSINVLANDINPAGGSLSLTAVSVLTSLPSATHTAVIVGNAVQFTPATGFAGIVTLTYTATDVNGATATGLVAITVIPSLTVLPPLALPDVAVLAQDSAATSINVLANDINPAGGSLSLTAVSVLTSLPSATHTAVIVSNTVQFTPAAGFAGIVTLTYTATDVNGATATGLVAITITPSSPVSLPLALPDVTTVAQDSAATSIDVLANDINPAGGSLSLTAVSVLTSLPSATHTAVIVGNAVQFTPATGFAGIVTLTYTATDVNGATATGLVAITVIPTLPIALPAAVGDVGSLVVTLLGGSTGNFNVLSNDINPTGGALTLQTVSFQNPLLVTAGSLLTVVGNQVQLTVPLVGVITGVLPIQYTAIDSLGRTFTGLLNVTISL